MHWVQTILKRLLELFGLNTSDTQGSSGHKIEQSPIETYRRIIAARTEVYSKLRLALTKVNTQMTTLQNELTVIADEYDLIALELDYAMMHGDDEAALELLEVRDDEDEVVEQKRVLIKMLEEQGQELLKQMSEVQSELSKLKMELQKVQADEAAIELQELVKQFEVDSGGQELKAARDAVAIRRASAEVDKILYENSTEVKRAQIKQNIAAQQEEQRRQAQLDCLKAHYLQNKLAQST